MSFINLVGSKFTRLTVIRRLESFENPFNGKVGWLCECDCGNIKKVPTNRLRNSMTKSCGCLNIEVVRKRRRLSKPWIVSFNRLVEGYRYRAFKKKLDFELSVDKCFMLFKGNCYYCSSSPTTTINFYTKKDGSVNRVGANISFPESAIFIYNGIDRLNNQLGYLDSNCVSCCQICNYAKLDLPLFLWDQWLTRISEKILFFSPTISDLDIETMTHPQKVSFNCLVKRYKDSAQKRNLMFNLTNSECFRIFKSDCSYCGIPASSIINPYIKKNGDFTKAGMHIKNQQSHLFLYNGIDRKDSNYGYTSIGDQSIPACYICNRAKSDISLENYILYLTKLSENRRGVVK